MGLINNVEELTREVGIYAEEIARLKKELKDK